jgi:hypothetical protein
MEFLMNIIKFLNTRPVLFSFYFSTICNNNMANAPTFEAGTPRTSGPDDVWQLTLEEYANFLR